MTTREMTVGYQNRNGLRRDLPARPQIVLANYYLSAAGFRIGDNIEVEYGHEVVVIRKVRP